MSAGGRGHPGEQWRGREGSNRRDRSREGARELANPSASSSVKQRVKEGNQGRAGAGRLRWTARGAQQMGIWMSRDESSQGLPYLLLPSISRPGLIHQPNERKANSPGLRFPARACKLMMISKKPASSLKASRFPLWVSVEAPVPTGTLTPCLTNPPPRAACYPSLLSFFQFKFR